MSEPKIGDVVRVAFPGPGMESWTGVIAMRTEHDCMDKYCIANKDSLHFAILIGHPKGWEYDHFHILAGWEAGTVGLEVLHAD